MEMGFLSYNVLSKYCWELTESVPYGDTTVNLERTCAENIESWNKANK